MMRAPPRISLFPYTTLFRSDQLILERQLWLDTDGRGWTFQDRLGGQLRRSWRLEMPAPATLGRAAVQAQDQPLTRSEEHTSELQSQFQLVCRLLLDKKNTTD